MRDYEGRVHDSVREAPKGRAGASDQPTITGLMQKHGGNAALARLLTSGEPGVAAALHPGRRAHAMFEEGKSGSDELEAQPIGFISVGPDSSAPPVNDDGLIDGEWMSSVAATVFVNAGKAGSGVVNWAGGNGGTTPGIGSSTSVAPAIETRPPAAAGGPARAWVRPGTGTVNVSRNYFGVLVGANATYYITAAAAARIDLHEQNHIAHSKSAHDAHLAPLEVRIAARNEEAKALSHGPDEAAAKAALIAELKWNESLTNFRDKDNADNLPGGAVDTADSASAGWYKDLGPRVVGGVNYAHFVDV